MPCVDAITLDRRMADYCKRIAMRLQNMNPGRPLISAALPEKYLAIPLEFDLSPDVRVMGFTLAASLLTGALFGLIPALRRQ